MGYTKLFSNIIHSTIWREDNSVRLLWITMLAIADFDGRVEASIPGLADAARISIADCEAGLLKLMSAVPYAWYVWENGFTGSTQLKWILV